MAVQAVEPEDAGDLTAFGTAISENIRTVVEMLLVRHRRKRDWLVDRLPLSRTSVYSRMKGETEFTGVELAILSRLFMVPVSIFFESPDSWLPRLDSNQQPAGYPPSRPHLSLVAC